MQAQRLIEVIIELTEEIFVEGWVKEGLDGTLYLAGYKIEQMINKAGIKRYWASKASEFLRLKGYKTRLSEKGEVLYPLNVVVEYWQKEASKGNKKAQTIVSEIKLGKVCWQIVPMARLN